MKHILTVWLVVMFTGVAHAIGVGDSQSDVTMALGKPSITRQTSDGAVIWKFKDGTLVRFESGVVQEITGPATPATHGTIGGPKAANPQTHGAANAPAATAGSQTEPSATQAETTPMAQNETPKQAVLSTRQLGYFFLIVGAIIGLVCKVMLWGVAYRVSGLWLLLCLFVPFASFVFIISYWGDTKKLVAWQFLVALPLIMAGIYLTPH